MNRIPRSPSRPRIVLLAGLALALGATALGCGPQQRFCADSGNNGVCPTPMDAPVQSDVMDAPPKDMGSIYVGNDANTTPVPDAGAGN